MSDYAIEAFNISKKYKGLNLDKKESGIGLWIKNISRLTSNKAESVNALLEVSFNNIDASDWEFRLSRLVLWEPLMID